MIIKPTYEDLEKKIEKLEQAASEFKRSEEALRESHRIIQGIVNAIPVRVFWKDQNLVYLGCNALFAKDAGFVDPQDIIGKDDYQMVWRDQAQLYRGDDRQVIESGCSKLFIEEPQTTALGKTVTVLTSRIPLLSSRGEINGVLGTYMDITQRKQMEKELQESEKKYHSLFHNAQVALFRTSLDGKLIEINKRYAQMAGYSTIEDCMADFSSGNAWADPEGRSKFLKILQKKGVVNDYEANIIPRDKNPIWILFSATIFPEQAFIEGSIVDITDRKRSEKVLQKREQQLIEMGNIAKIGGWEHDLITREATWTILTYQILDLDPQGPASGPDDHLAYYLPGDRDIIEKAYNLSIETGEQFDHQLQFTTVKGRLIWVRIVGRPGYKDGVCITMKGTIQDITEHKKLEQQLLHAQKMESIGRLAGGVAHDFNNMLSIILGNTEMILEDLDPTNPVIGNLLEIQKAAERSTELTRQLLAFARKQTIAPEVLDLNEIIEGMLKMLQRLIGENIDLAWLPKKNLWVVKMDPSQVDQILANLCVNAKDSIKDVGKLTIETDNVSFDNAYCFEHDGFNPGDYVILALTDNGCGMDKKILDKIFEPFFTTKGVGEGTGLGLATVYGIVKQNNGFIHVYSEPNQGTTFRIYFPRHGGKDLPTQKLASKKADSTGRETILLVEDEKAILTMVAIMLERLGYTVFAASNPDEAITIGTSKAGKIHLLMTDVVMPGMNGRALAKEMVQLVPNLKCLFMSGYTANVIAHHGILDSGMQFIQKPFSRKELAAKVREVLDKIR